MLRFSHKPYPLAASSCGLGSLSCCYLCFQSAHPLILSSPISRFDPPTVLGTCVGYQAMHWPGWTTLLIYYWLDLDTQISLGT